MRRPAAKTAYFIGTTFGYGLFLVLIIMAIVFTAVFANTDYIFYGLLLTAAILCFEFFGGDENAFYTAMFKIENSRLTLYRRFIVHVRKIELDKIKRVYIAEFPTRSAGTDFYMFISAEDTVHAPGGDVLRQYIKGNTDYVVITLNPRNFALVNSSYHGSYFVEKKCLEKLSWLNIEDERICNIVAASAEQQGAAAD